MAITRRILVVDDSAVILYLMEDLLCNEAGYEVMLSGYQPDLVEWIKAMKLGLI